jgi:CBS domain-containing protein
MNTMPELDSTTVRDAMNVVEVTVSPTQKLEEVATLFRQHHLHSAPVVDERDKCIGIITSHDLVRFQSELSKMDSRLDQGMSYDVSERSSGGGIELVPHPFDEVQRHMSTGVQTVEGVTPLLHAARIMCQQQIHHLIVLDDSERPVGVLSSLDILARLQG